MLNFIFIFYVEFLTQIRYSYISSLSQLISLLIFCSFSVFCHLLYSYLQNLDKISIVMSCLNQQTCNLQTLLLRCQAGLTRHFWRERITKMKIWLIQNIYINILSKRDICNIQYSISKHKLLQTPKQSEIHSLKNSTYLILVIYIENNRQMS